MLFKEHVKDRTAWQAMLKGQGGPVALDEERDRLYEITAEGVDALQQQYGLQAVARLDQDQQYEFNYPVTEYPTKVSSLNLDKNPLVEGVLKGIKGQYLIFDTGVINMRKYGGYHLALSAQ